MRRENRRNQRKRQIDRIAKTGRIPKSIHHPLPPPSRHSLAALPPISLSTTSPLGCSWPSSQRKPPTALSRLDLSPLLSEALSPLNHSFSLGTFSVWAYLSSSLSLYIFLYLHLYCSLSLSALCFSSWCFFNDLSLFAVCRKCHYFFFFFTITIFSFMFLQGGKTHLALDIFFRP